MNYLFWLVVLGEMFATLTFILAEIDNNERREPRRLRGLQSEVPVLRCKVVAVDTEYDRHSENDRSYMCLPIINGILRLHAYGLDLPQDFLAENNGILPFGDVEMIIPGGELIDDHVYIPTGSIIEAIDEPLRPIWKSAMAVLDAPQVDVPEADQQFVTRRMLVVRVSTIDSSPSLKLTDLQDHFFANRTLTLRSQYLACSHGKLTFDPVPDSVSPGNIFGGVMDVQLGIAASLSTRHNLTNAAITATEALLGFSITSVADNVVFCHPPGSLGDWAAYAFLNNHVSVHNDKWCGYISTTIHEVGHTLGFLHSNQNGEYGDTTGYMGYSYGTPGWPSICFNGRKNWQAGWFQDRSISVNPVDGVWRGKLASFVDYQLTSPGEYVVINVGKLYFQINSAKGPNFQTRQMRNQVTIVEDRPKGSELLVGLDGLNYFSKFYRNQNYGPNGETLFIAVCATYLGDNITKPDVMLISIGLDVIDCSVEKTVSPTESPIPSPSPSVVPTIAPTRTNFPSESPAPSPSPSKVVSMPPTSQTTRFPTESPIPSPSPSKVPSLQPSESLVPTSTHSASWTVSNPEPICTDNRDGYFIVDTVLGTKNCSWLQNRPEMIAFLCIAGLPAYDQCPETCGKCIAKCKDGDDSFLYNTIMANCSWVKEQDILARESICKASEPSMYCLDTCDKCRSPIDNGALCEDDPSKLFPVLGVGNRSCAWLADSENQGFQEYFCQPNSEILHICPQTCNKCIHDCKDDPSAEFLYRGKSCDCSWLASRQFLWIELCVRDDINSSCQKTCESC